MIRPTYWTDPQYAAMTEGARLVAVWSWCAADDEGRFYLDPVQVRSAVFWSRQDVTADQVRAWCSEVVACGRWLAYTLTNGQVVAQVRNFLRYQRPRAPTPSDIPPPDEDVLMAYEQCWGDLDEQPKANSPAAGANGDMAQQWRDLFDWWVVETGRDPARTKPTGDRKAKVLSCLRAGYTAEQIKEAVRGVRSSAWHMGEEGTRQGKGPLDDLLTGGRVPSRVEEWARLGQRGEVVRQDDEISRLRAETIARSKQHQQHGHGGGRGSGGAPKGKPPAAPVGGGIRARMARGGGQ